MVLRTVQRRYLKNSNIFFMSSSSSVVFHCHTLHKHKKNICLWLWKEICHFCTQDFLYGSWILNTHCKSSSWGHWTNEACSGVRSDTHISTAASVKVIGIHCTSWKLSYCICTVNLPFGSKKLEHTSISWDKHKAYEGRHCWLKLLVFKIIAILLKLNN